MYRYVSVIALLILVALGVAALISDDQWWLRAYIVFYCFCALVMIVVTLWNARLNGW